MRTAVDDLAAHAGSDPALLPVKGDREGAVDRHAPRSEHGPPDRAEIALFVFRLFWFRGHDVRSFVHKCAPSLKSSQIGTICGECKAGGQEWLWPASSSGHSPAST